MALAFDAMDSASGLTGGGGTQDVNCTVGSVSSHAFILLIGAGSLGGDLATGISGITGVTWTKLSTGAGNGTFRGEVWYGLGLASTGAKTATIALAANTVGAVGAFLYSYTGANQTAPANGFVVTISGDNVITVASGDGAVSASVDTNNNRTVSGCTSSTDVSTFGSAGISSAHCTGTPTSTFTWSGFGTNSVVVGCSVLQAASGPTANKIGSMLTMFQ